jgi:uncharacterized protein involved in type VI secretion and phage assembly
MALVNGVVSGLVTAVDGEGRVKVHCEGIDDSHETDWIRIATMMGGNDRGSFFMPEVNDEVLLSFENGHPRIPIVVGFFWNGKDKPPGQDFRDRILKSKNGHSIRFLDSTVVNGDKGALVIEDAHGNRVTMSNGKVTVYSKGHLELRSEGNVIVSGPGWTRVVTPNSNPI